MENHAGELVASFAPVELYPDTPPILLVVDAALFLGFCRRHGIG
jgi:hypothetical protein